MKLSYKLIFLFTILLYISLINSKEIQLNVELDGFLKNQNEYIDSNLLKHNKNYRSNNTNYLYDSFHIIDILGNNLKDNNILKNINIQDEKYFKKIIKKNEKNIVGISYGNGLVFTNGLLINNQYILTSSSLIYDEYFNQLKVRYNFKKDKVHIGKNKNSTNIMNYGESYDIEGITEVNDDLGYAILKLVSRVPSINKKIKLKSNDSQLKIIYHHHFNGPKKIGLLYHLDKIEENKNYKELEIENGIYFDRFGNFIGLLNEDNGKIIKSSDIYNTSIYFKKLLNNNNNGKEKIPNYLQHQKIQFASLRGSKRPRYPGPTLPSPHTPPLARHHIIPYGTMESLWQLSLEYPKIKELFHVINKKPTFQYVVWSYWNIFSGPEPSLRYHKNELEKIFGKGTLGYDPENSVEPLKPISFNEEQWKIMQDLNNLLDSTYHYRSHKLFKQNSSEKIILQSSLNEYSNRLELIFNLLNQNRLFLGKVGALHDYNENDWIKLNKKYYISSNNQ